MLTLNWLALLGAAIAYYLLGAAWFTPLFGRLWDRSIGHDRSRSGPFPPAYYVVPLVGAATGTVVVGLLLAAIGTESVTGGVVTGAGVGLVAAAASFTNALTPHTPRPYLFGAVTAGYHVVGLTMVGALLGAWS